MKKVKSRISEKNETIIKKALTKQISETKITLRFNKNPYDKIRSSLQNMINIIESYECCVKYKNLIKRIEYVLEKTCHRPLGRPGPMYCTPHLTKIDKRLILSLIDEIEYHLM